MVFFSKVIIGRVFTIFILAESLYELITVFEIEVCFENSVRDNFFVFTLEIKKIIYQLIYFVVIARVLEGFIRKKRLLRY